MARPTSTALTSAQLRSIIERPEETVRGRTVPSILHELIMTDNVKLLERLREECQNIHREKAQAITAQRSNYQVLSQLMEAVEVTDNQWTDVGEEPNSAVVSSSVCKVDARVYSSRHCANIADRTMQTYVVAHGAAKLPDALFSRVINTKVKDTTLLIHATQNLSMKVFLFLLDLPRGMVDIEREGTARFEGEERISGATPLWTAAAMGSLEMVKLLVRAGARVNHVSATNSTPVRAACYDGYFEVVRYLVSNGGDVNTRNRLGSGPLHLLCYRGFSEIAEYLLQHGADPNTRTCTELESPLHHAALMGHAEVTKVLVDHRADTSAKSLIGTTALMQAAGVGEEDVVNELLLSQSPPVTQKEKLCAYLLLGATFIDRHQYPQKALQYWKLVLELAGDEGMAYPSGPLPLMPVYGNIQYPATVAELRHIMADSKRSYNLASAIREHVLGATNPETVHYLRCRSAMAADARQYADSIRLWMHCIKLEMTRGRKGQVPEVHASLLTCSELLAEQISAEGEGDIKPFFDLVWTNLYRHAVGGVEFGKTLRVLLTLLYIWDGLSDDKPHHHVPCQESARRLMQLRCSLHKGYNDYSILHLVCDKKTFSNGARSRKTLCPFPCAPVLKLLLENGGSEEVIVQPDRYGNMPLHIAAESNSIGCVRELVARMTPDDVERKNVSGKSALDVANGDAVKSLLSVYKEASRRRQRDDASIVGFDDEDGL